MKPTEDNSKSILRDRRGAVLVEFVIALMPMMMTFFGFVEVSRIYAASLGTKHAAITAARAAAVMSKVHGNNPANQGGEAEIKQAAGQALGPWIGNGAVSKVEVTVHDQSSKSDPYGPVTVKVVATYHCKVPLMGKFICKGGIKNIPWEATMPHQGANYKVSSSQ